MLNIPTYVHAEYSYYFNKQEKSYYKVLLLGKDLETNNETSAVAMQRRGKHAFRWTEFLLKLKNLHC
jgi:hypothetical protein